MGLAQFSDRRREKKNMEKIIVENRKILESSLGPKSGGRAPIKTKWVKVGQKVENTGVALSAL